MILCLVIALAGFPVLASAKAQCPMMSKMRMSSMQDMQKGKPCEHCAKMAKQEQKKRGCCGDVACAAECASMTNAGNALFGMQSALLSFVSSTKRFYSSDPVLVSQFLHTQERPPKYLS